MSTCIISLKTLTSHTTLKSAPLRRRYCHAATTASPPPMQHIQMLGQSQLQNVVVLESHFTPPTTKHEIDPSPLLGTGFFLHPTLLATSIHSVARLSPSLRAQIARTLAFTHRGAVMLTTPLALNFSKGIALFQCVETDAMSASRKFDISSSPDRPLYASSHRCSFGTASVENPLLSSMTRSNASVTQNDVVNFFHCVRVDPRSRSMVVDHKLNRPADIKRLASAAVGMPLEDSLLASS